MIPTFDPTWSDGCSCSPEFDFHAICVEHDKCYFYGDSNPDKVSRLTADKCLRQGIVTAGYDLKHKGLAWIYFLAVRSMGWKFWNGWDKKGTNYGKTSSIFKSKRLRYTVAISAGILTIGLLIYGIFLLKSK